MLLSDFDYQLPEELIAQTPIEPRDAARLLVYSRATGEVSHQHVRDLPSLLPPATTITVNTSRVRKCRLFTTNGQEVLVLTDCGNNQYQCLVRGKAPQPGALFDFGPELQATVIAPLETPGMTVFILEFQSTEPIEAALDRLGQTPLPPYIHNHTAPDERYQTIYAGPLGSAAAPTAGLHFTPELLTALEQAGHHKTEVTLHVGIGTFLPLRKEEIKDNTLHTEITQINPTTATQLSSAISHNQPLLAVGTTSLRTLEGHWNGTTLTAGTQPTNIFIYPGKQIQTANALLTNFHLPKSSLLVLVAAFLGNTADRALPQKSEQEMIAGLQNLYATAIAEQYHFFSFGDAMLIL